ncbi:haloacid dehalogenase protein [Candidatus Regiella insecticola 5.15]|uniref:Haloacid dehalogenase protein n=1 Tax=Candidatus Regiella insecticola 5.15 TaxID=1005043 RepID=G2GXP5_9ENTR|nr:HAD family phosphatase [Candidatus Regiella insecticola]EGY29487.1 haloacid dehalogenase protein [Candidatus Regiella insecticola 5.15]
MAQLSALLFDLDGTLVNTEWPNALAYTEAIRAFGGEIDPTIVRTQAVGLHWTQFLPKLLVIAGLEIDPQLVANRKRELYANYLNNLELNYALLDLIKVLREHVKIGLVTTASRQAVEAIDKVSGLFTLFNCVITGDDVAKAKPAPEAYQLAASKLGLSPSECLIFEDSSSGVASAEAFGAQTLKVLFAWK